MNSHRIAVSDCLCQSITFWYPVEERSVRIAFVLASATAAGAFGGCIAYGVGHLNGSGNLEGFRWRKSDEDDLVVERDC